MHFEVEKTYHIYNRSNETVFFNRDNYLYFLAKTNKLLVPCADILSWCLMPNHFHLLIVTKEYGCQFIDEKHRPNVQNLSKNIGTLLSSYTRAINKEHNRKGSLFSHNTTTKCLNDEFNNDNFLTNCFHYIHQNPVRADLCDEMIDWEFSSYLDFAGVRNGKLVNKELAFDMINFDKDNFEVQSRVIIKEGKMHGFY